MRVRSAVKLLVLLIIIALVMASYKITAIIVTLIYPIYIGLEFLFKKNWEFHWEIFHHKGDYEEKEEFPETAEVY